MSDLILEFVEHLNETEREVLRFHIEAFDYARRIMPTSNLIRRMVDLGPPLGERMVYGETEQDIVENTAILVASKRGLIELEAEKYFEDSVLRPEELCLLPSRDLLLEKAAKTPIFNLIVASHDNECPRCGFNDSDTFMDQSGDVVSEGIGKLSKEEQKDIIAWGQRFLDCTFSHSRLIAQVSDLEYPEDPSALEEWMTAVAHPRRRCALAEATVHENLLWTLQHPLLLWSLIDHAVNCPKFSTTFTGFERIMVDLLADDDRALYHRCARALMEGKSEYIVSA